MKKTIMKMAAISLCAAVTLSGSMITASAASDQGQPEKKAAESAGTEAAKDETVYVLAGADGSVQKIIVSDWIKNTQGAAALNDKTDLTGVENVKGDESYTLGGDGGCVWDAQGNDIYYQGTIEKELPVALSVSYKLDGKEISADELVGKSGRVTIRFDYRNDQYETVEIDGRQEKIYVPFAMLTGILMDNDVFTNIEVSNGKLINDGDRTAVIGIAFPGLQEDLAVSEDKFKIPDYVEISADAENFELGMTVTLATNELFNEFDTESVGSAAGLSGSMNELTDAMGQLLDGSSQLYEGLSTLLDKSGELVTGIDALAAGAGELKAGADSLNTGADTLQSGAAKLSDGLNTLVSNNDTLNGGARQVFETLLSTANTQLTAAGLEVPALTIDNYAKVLDGVVASLGQNAAQGQTQAAAAAMQAQMAAAAQSVTALKASLDSYNVFYLGLQTYTSGVADAAAGAGTLKAGTDDLKDGTSQLTAGASQLYDGILALKDGTPALVDGITQLRDGSMQLSEGLKEFNEQGIQKLVGAVGGNLDGLLTRLRATRDVSLRYQNFSGVSDDMDGQVKFIYRTDAIEP